MTRTTVLAVLGIALGVAVPVSFAQPPPRQQRSGPSGHITVRATETRTGSDVREGGVAGTGRFRISGVITDKGKVTDYRTVKGGTVTLRRVTAGARGTITSGSPSTSAGRARRPGGSPLPRAPTRACTGTAGRPSTTSTTRRRHSCSRARSRGEGRAEVNVGTRARSSIGVVRRRRGVSPRHALPRRARGAVRAAQSATSAGGAVAVRTRSAERRRSGSTSMRSERTCESSALSRPQELPLPDDGVSHPVARTAERPSAGTAGAGTGEPELTQDGRRHAARTAARHGGGSGDHAARRRHRDRHGVDRDHRRRRQPDDRLRPRELSVGRVGALVGRADRDDRRVRRQRSGTLAGQLVAVLVMLLGIGFLTVITAAITSTFVSRSRREQAPSDAETAMAEQFRQLDSRLERIEAALAPSLVVAPPTTRGPTSRRARRQRTVESRRHAGGTVTPARQSPQVDDARQVGSRASCGRAHTCPHTTQKGPTDGRSATRTRLLPR